MISNIADINDNKALSPVMMQYNDIKIKYKNYFVFFRIGDFFELFYDDAIKVNKILGLTITHKSNNKNIPMCGIPHNMYLNYGARLIREGYSIVICDQIGEQPLKGIMKREVTKILTKSTIFYEGNIFDLDNHFIMGIGFINKQEVFILFMDIGTEEYFYKTCDIEDLTSFISNINPEEIIINKNDKYEDLLKEILYKWRNIIQIWDISNSNYFKNIWNNYIDNLGLLQQQIVETMLSYLHYHGIKLNNLLNCPQEFPFKKNIKLMDNTIESLNIINKNNTSDLLRIIDKTQTPMGYRLLKKSLCFPSTDLNNINYIQQNVQFFFNRISNNILLDLKDLGDMEKMIIQAIRKTIKPSILLKLGKSLEISHNIIHFLRKEGLSMFGNNTSFCVHEIILYTLNDNIIDDNNYINPNNIDEILIINKNIDKLNNDIDSLITKYESQYGISNLKYKNNNIHGYFLETPKSQINIIKNNPIFFIINHVVNNVRFKSMEFTDLVEKLENIKSQQIELEKTIFNNLLDKIKEYYDDLIKMSRVIGNLDLYYSFALKAKERSYICPVINNNNSLYIKNGRHPIADETIKNFIPNSIEINNEDNIHIITGPNVGGKSTFLRQVGVILILSHIGSFIPAEDAIIGIVDNIFTRIGSNDNFLENKSTFLIELEEISYMLREVTSKSFIIIDEFGRGTSEQDGLFLAASLLKHLYHIVHCKCLFATHFHGLFDLVPYIKTYFYTNYFHNDKGDIQFTYELIQGRAKESFGICAAKLAKIPDSIINDAITLKKSLIAAPILLR